MAGCLACWRSRNVLVRWRGRVVIKWRRHMFSPSGGAVIMAPLVLALRSRLALARCWSITDGAGVMYTSTGAGAAITTSVGATYSFDGAAAATTAGAGTRYSPIGADAAITVGADAGTGDRQTTGSGAEVTTMGATAVISSRA